MSKYTKALKVQKENKIYSCDLYTSKNDIQSPTGKYFSLMVDLVYLYTPLVSISNLGSVDIDASPIRYQEGNEVYCISMKFETINNTSGTPSGKRVLSLKNYARDNIENWRQIQYLPESNVVDLTDIEVSADASSAFGTTDSNVIATSKFVNLSNVEVTWDMSNVTTTRFMFDGCEKLESLNVSNWNVSNVVDMAYMFSTCHSLISLDLNSWDTHNVTNMSWMFGWDVSLKVLDLSHWNVSNVTDMSYMFYETDELFSLNISTWDTSNVTDMSRMFAAFCCNAGTYDEETRDFIPYHVSLDLSSFNTSNVTTMEGMFYGADSLYILDLSNFDTRNHEVDMSYMFGDNNDGEWQESVPKKYLIINSPVFKFEMKDSDCGYLSRKCKILVPRALLNTYKTAENWSTRADQFHAIEDYIIFKWKGKIHIESIYDIVSLRYWATNNVLGFPDATRLSSSNIHDLTNITLDTDATCAIGMEFDAGSDDHVYFETLDGVEATWNTSHVEIMESMFYNCQELTELDVSGWDVSSVTSMAGMFDRCYSLASLDVSNWDVSSLTSMDSLFCRCYSLTHLDVSNWNTSNVTSMEWAFGWTGLTSLDLSRWNTSNVTDMGWMFKCDSDSALTVLDLSNFDTTSIVPLTSRISGMYEMFDTHRNATPLEYLIIGSPVFKFIMWDSNCGDLPRTTKILVPRELLSTYQNATNWSTRADQFHAIEDYTIVRSNGQVTVTPK